MQVQTAVNAIVATGVVLDEALECPPPADRDEAERRAASLRSQIESIGPVNAVAMDEYLRLKERYDYIEEQVTDLEGRPCVAAQDHGGHRPEDAQPLPDRLRAG